MGNCSWKASTTGGDSRDLWDTYIYLTGAGSSWEGALPECAGLWFPMPAQFGKYRLCIAGANPLEPLVEGRYSNGPCHSAEITSRQIDYISGTLAVTGSTESGKTSEFDGTLPSVRSQDRHEIKDGPEMVYYLRL